MFTDCAHRSAYAYKETRTLPFTKCDTMCTLFVIVILKMLNVMSVVKGTAHLHTSTGTTSNTLHMNNFHGLNLFSSTHSLLFRHSFCRLYVSTLHFSTVICLLWFFFSFPLSLSLRVSIRLVCLFSI